MQGHWGLDYPTEEELEESIKKFKELGYIAITELDIDVLPNPSGSDTEDVYVGRIRSQNLDGESWISMWIVADNVYGKGTTGSADLRGLEVHRQRLRFHTPITEWLDPHNPTGSET